MMRTVSIVALLLMLEGSRASAQEIPEYDSSAHCERISRDRSDGDNRARSRCLWVEDYARDEVETFWPHASIAMRRLCMDAADEEESYATLATCILRRLRDARLEQ